jgi:hypothetical protein
MEIPQSISLRSLHFVGCTHDQWQLGAAVMEHREVNAAFALPFIILRTRLHSERRK